MKIPPYHPLYARREIQAKYFADIAAHEARIEIAQGVFSLLQKYEDNFAYFYTSPERNYASGTIYVKKGFSEHHNLVNALQELLADAEPKTKETSSGRVITWNLSKPFFFVELTFAPEGSADCQRVVTSTESVTNVKESYRWVCPGDPEYDQGFQAEEVTDPPPVEDLLANDIPF